MQGLPHPAAEDAASPAIDPRVVAFNRMTARALAEVAAVYTKPIDETRRERADWAQRARHPDARWIVIAGLRLREFGASSVQPVYFHLHGGGWVFGGADQQDAMLAELAEAAGVTVLSLDYRLAPEHPYPAAVDDASAALRALLDEAGDRPLVVGGESAGANLAVAALRRLRGHPHYARIRAASLHYGTYDRADGSDSLRAAGPDTPFLDARLADWFAAQYASAAQRRDPEVSPLLAGVDDFAGLPPALFLVGSEDPVHDDSRLLAERWRAAGNRAELALLPGGLHSLLELRTPLTAQGRQRVAEFVRSACAGAFARS